MTTDTPSGRRLCAHADGSAPMHLLEPTETCEARFRAAHPGLLEEAEGLSAEQRAALLAWLVRP